MADFIGRAPGAAGAVVPATDATGRRFEIRVPGALERLRLFKALGGDLSMNAPYFGMALLACSVTTIDGVPVPQPSTEEQIESLVHRLGDGGIAAVAEVLESAAGPALSRIDQGN